MCCHIILYRPLIASNKNISSTRYKISYSWVDWNEVLLEVQKAVTLPLSPDAAHPPRATARVPTPLHTAPALTMIRCSVLPLSTSLYRRGLRGGGCGHLRAPLTANTRQPA